MVTNRIPYRHCPEIGQLSRESRDAGEIPGGLRAAAVRAALDAPLPAMPWSPRGAAALPRIGQHGLYGRLMCSP